MQEALVQRTRPLLTTERGTSLSRGVARAVGKLGSGLDRFFVNAAMRGHAARREQHIASDVVAVLSEAKELYGSPEGQARLFATPHPLAGPVERLVESFDEGSMVDLTWPSTYQPIHPTVGSTFGRQLHNNTVHVRWYRHEAIAPTLVCLHGWGGGYFRFEAMAFSAGQLYNAGFDVLLFTLPHHGRRAARPGLPDFPSTNPMRTNEGFAQAVWDLRCLLGYLRERGTPTLGVTGMSLGGFTASLLATVESEIDFVVPIIPVASMAEMIWGVGQGTRAQRNAEALGATFELFFNALAPTSPLLRPPQISKDRFLVIAGESDAVVPADHPDRLAEHFGGDIVRFPGSHLVHAGRQEMIQALLRFARHHADSRGAPRSS